MKSFPINSSKSRYEVEVELSVVFMISISAGNILPRQFSNLGLFIDIIPSMYQLVRLNRNANCFFPVESKDCMNSASYEYRKISGRYRICTSIRSSNLRMHNVNNLVYLNWEVIYFPST